MERSDFVGQIFFVTLQTLSSTQFFEIPRSSSHVSLEKVAQGWSNRVVDPCQCQLTRIHVLSIHLLLDYLTFFEGLKLNNRTCRSKTVIYLMVKEFSAFSAA